MPSVRNIFLFLLVISLIPACHPVKKERTEQKEEIPQKEETPSPSVLQPPDRPKAKIDAEWHDAMEHQSPEQSQRHETAYRLLMESERNRDLTLKSSIRLGDWFVLETNPPDPAHGAPDIEGKRRFAFVIDMAGQKVVKTDDWDYVLPFFQAIAREAPVTPSMQTPQFVRNTARFAAAAAAENAPIFEPVPGQTYPPGVGAPKLSVRSGMLILTWFSSNQATPPMFIRYEIRVSDILTFESAIVGDEPSETILHSL